MSFSYWGAELSVQQILKMINSNELSRPNSLRKYFWSKADANRFIESALLGIPFQNIYISKGNKCNFLIDGYQRIMSLDYYVYKNRFYNEKTLFSLVSANSRWNNRTFGELSYTDQDKLLNTLLPIYIFDDTGLNKSELFSRINCMCRFDN